MCATRFGLVERLPFVIRHAVDDLARLLLAQIGAGCRNCLSNWYLDAATAAGADLSKEESREIVYGMSYDEWKALNQSEASGAQKSAFEINRPKE
ncbi:MAG: DUF1244 domain-containing protein [Rhizobium sp.]|nr:DUF1244 domain-containing protein [Rhizobium sp.]